MRPSRARVRFRRLDRNTAMRNRFGRWLTLAPFLICGLSAQTTIIDSGSATDSNFTGGTAFTMPNPPAGVTDATMRFTASGASTFSYDVPCHLDWPYSVKLYFLEPNQTAVGQRIFTVRINNQVVLDHLDLIAEGGLGKMLSRSVVVMGADDGQLHIRFETNKRSAVVSSIEFTPLFQLVNTSILNSNNIWTGTNVWMGAADFTGSLGISLPNPPWVSRETANMYTPGMTQTFPPNSSKGGIRLIAAPQPKAPDAGTLNLSETADRIEWWDGAHWRAVIGTVQ